MPGTELVLYTGPREPELPPLWWLSFADPDLPTGQQFLGVAIVAAPSFPEAVMISHVLGINPGGEVAAEGPLPYAELQSENVTARLLSADEALAVQWG